MHSFARLRPLGFVVAAALLLAGCGGGGGPGGGSSSSSAATTGSSSAGSAASGSVAKTVTIQPKGNQMKFKETDITVPAGATVKIVFDNTATSPSMKHNVVVLDTAPKDGVFQRVGEGGMAAGSANDYVPDDEAVLAATGIANPGEEVSVTFTTPSEPGDYGYLCTFPGHWATMQGTMTVQ